MIPTFELSFGTAFGGTSKGSGTVSLDHAFNLRAAQGERKWWTRHARASQLLALRDAYIALHGEAPIGQKTCEALAAGLAQFAAGYWPTWREYEQPPAGASALRQALFRYFRKGG